MKSLRFISPICIELRRTCWWQTGGGSGATCRHPPYMAWRSTLPSPMALVAMAYVGSSHKPTPLYTTSLQRHACAARNAGAAFPPSRLQARVLPLLLPAPTHSPLGHRSPRLPPPTPLPPQHSEPARATCPSCLGISWFNYQQSGIMYKEGKRSFCFMIKICSLSMEENALYLQGLPRGLLKLQVTDVFIHVACFLNPIWSGRL